MACPPSPTCAPAAPTALFRDVTPEVEVEGLEQEGENDQSVEPARATSLVRVEADLDEDGTAEVLEMFSDGHLRLGEGAWHVPVHPPMDDAPWQGGFEIVDVRRGDGYREVLFWQVIPDVEDPPIEITVLSVRGPSVSSIQSPIVVPSSVRPTVRGDGRIRLRRSHCDGGRVVWRDIEHRMERDGTMRFVRSHLDASAATCFEAACPYVFVGAEHPRLVGEILRNVVGAAAEIEQSLALPIDAVAPDGTLTVTLRELKPEITYLDAIYVRVGDRIVAPIGCEGPACTADAEHLTLSMGQSQTFVFDVGTEARTIELVARGYYDPIVR